MSKNFSRRDRLLSIEREIQGLWENQHVYEINASDLPSTFNKETDKFFVNFPYPYMNGKLHLGHAFSLTKAEFISRFYRLVGKHVLFPFSFHCTGMPIQAAANKIKRELSEETHNESKVVIDTSSEEEENVEIDVKKFKGKKNKVKAKSGTAKTQIEIMKSMGIEHEEIPKFADPYYWLEYFIPRGKVDLERFGVSVDWRRSFMTTDACATYDAFIRWQFNRLKELGKIKFGKRPTIYSLLDGQPCADHDRATGEGVNPQEYTLIKMKLIDYGKFAVKVNEEIKAKLDGLKNVHFVAATLRPETMYGQTNLFILPTGSYGGFQASENGDVFIMSERSALNLYHQGGLISNTPLFQCLGEDFIGSVVHAPLSLSMAPTIILPMKTISMTKGTGIVTSVPADSPDDYVSLTMVKENPVEHGIVSGALDSVEIIPIISLRMDDEVTNLGAVDIVEKLNVFNLKGDPRKKALEEAKKTIYKIGFYEGELIVGDYSGESVQIAKPKVKQDLIKSQLAISYYEPEKPVISRSGDECIVAICDQWYLTYGSDEEWLKIVENHVQDPTQFKSFSNSARNAQITAASWLKQWACSRNFGLGTKLPWDSSIVIESLSDSTIYMAFYTIYHLIEHIDPTILTDDFFNKVFIDRDLDISNDVHHDIILKCRKEFNSFYPFDLRCSGKDLIPNHLTMCLFNHAAIWSENMMPKGFYVNGHVCVDDEKMSKSVGNFLTVEDALGEFGADATRLALADAGDDLEKANFKRKTANDNVLGLTTFETWANDFISHLRGKDILNGIRPADSPKNFIDLAIENEAISLVHKTREAYESMRFRDALKYAWFDYQNLREQYRILCMGNVGGVHADVLDKSFLQNQLIVISPITPHLSENLWRSRFGDVPSIFTNGVNIWPNLPDYDRLIGNKYRVLQSSLRDYRVECQKYMKKMKNPKNVSAIIYTSDEYLDFQKTTLCILKEILSANPDLDNGSTMRQIQSHELYQKLEKPLQSKCMKFASFHFQNEYTVRGISAFSDKLDFNEYEMLESMGTVICSQLNISTVQLVNANTIDDVAHKCRQAYPGKSCIIFTSE